MSPGGGLDPAQVRVAPSWAVERRRGAVRSGWWVRCAAGGRASEPPASGIRARLGWRWVVTACRAGLGARGPVALEKLARSLGAPAGPPALLWLRGPHGEGGGPGPTLLERTRQGTERQLRKERESGEGEGRVDHLGGRGGMGLRSPFDPRPEEVRRPQEGDAGRGTWTKEERTRWPSEASTRS